MPKKLKHKDTQDTDTQTTQAQGTDGQDTDAQGTEDQSRGEQARPYLENASYPAHREDLAASAQQQGADQDVVDRVITQGPKDALRIEGRRHQSSRRAAAKVRLRFLTDANRSDGLIARF